MSFHYKQAVGSGRRLRLGIAGPSRSGKTYSALTIATGMMKQSGGKIFVIDTENEFSLDYADEFSFQHVDFQPPFTPERYMEAIKYCEDNGAGIIIVDSATHEHTGTGGVLEHQEQLCEDLAKKWNCKREKVTMAAWAQAKKPHTDYVSAVQRCKLPIIFCFRAKDKIKIVNVNGKQEIIHVGWTAICTEQFEYEMTALLVLPPNSEGKADQELSEVRAPLRPILKVGQQITQQIGIELAAWAKGGVPASAPAQPDGEYIGVDAAIEIDDMLAKHPALKRSLLGKVGSIAKIPASKYQETKDWIEKHTGAV